DDDEIVEEAQGECNGDSSADIVSPAQIRYYDGSLKYKMRDLESRGFGKKFGYTRWWTNDDAYLLSPTLVNGDRTIVSQLPYVLRNYAGVNPEPLAVVTNGVTARFFTADGLGGYPPAFFVRDPLSHDTTNHRYVLTDTAGNQVRFYDYDVPGPQGQFDTFVDAYGSADHTITASRLTSAPNKVQEVQRYDQAAGKYESYAFAYYDLPNAYLKSVTRRRGPTTTGPWTTVRHARYSYYDGSTAEGNAGNLKSAEILDEDPALNPLAHVLDVSYYRYYKTGEADSFVNALKFVVS